MANIVKYWECKGFYYEAQIILNNRDSYGVITKRLNFFSYHIIRLIYGEDELRDMAARYTSMGDR